MVGKWVADWDFVRRTTPQLCDTSTSTKEDGNYGWKVGRRLGFCEKNHATALRHLHVDERGRQPWFESGSPIGIFREEPRHNFATPPRRRKRTATMVGKWAAGWDFQRRTTPRLCDTSTSTKEDGNYGWKVGRRLGFSEKNHATTSRHLHVDERGRQLWLESGRPVGIFREEPRHDFATPPRRRKRTATMVGKWVADWDFQRRTTPQLRDTSTSTKEDGNYGWKVGRRVGFCEKNHATTLRHLHVDERGRQLWLESGSPIGIF